jgi:hypothetical protein
MLWMRATFIACCAKIAGLINYEGSTWLKAINSNQAVVFLKRGNIKAQQACAR